LFSRIFAITPECDFFIFAATKEPLVAFSENFRLPNVTFVPMPHRSAPARLLLQLPWLAKKNKLDLLHTQYITPPVSACQTAVTVHDILFESRPEFFDRSFVLRSRTLVPLSVRRSAMVFTVSEFSAREICGTYKTEQEKVVTIFNGVDAARFLLRPPNLAMPTILS
jgi:hypothetical protein